MKKRRILRSEKKRIYMMIRYENYTLRQRKDNYESKTKKILKIINEYYKTKHDEVHDKQAAYYRRSRSAMCQR